MENKVYYGEYSLEHWIELMLNEKIILPEYQRHFVWKENKVETLIRTFRDNEFVPPVTIGVFKKEGSEPDQNLILDGQQRLTSILLAYLGLFPKKEKIKSEKLVSYAYDNDDFIDEDEQEYVVEWTFRELIKKGKTKKDILDKATEDYYEIHLEWNIDDLLKTTYLSFCYLVPSVHKENQGTNLSSQQKYYSSVFRNINIQGETLLAQESRASLYFLDSSLKDFFEPKFSKEILIKNGTTDTHLDFVRYTSLLSQYYADPNINSVAKGYRSKMEKYYEEYIYSVVNENKDNSTFSLFTKIFPDKVYQPRLDKLKQAIKSLEISKDYTSIIDMDMYLFGLIYFIVLENKTIDSSDKDKLKEDIQNAIDELRQDEKHKRTPSAFKYLRMRIERSIEIYKQYAR